MTHPNLPARVAATAVRVAKCHPRFDETEAARPAAQVEGEALTPAQRRAVDLLALGHSTHFVAQELSVDKRTVFRWRAEPEFAVAMRRAMEESAVDFQHAARLLLQQAMRVMQRSMSDECEAWRVAARILQTRRLWKVATPLQPEAPPSKDIAVKTGTQEMS